MDSLHGGKLPVDKRQGKESPTHNMELNGLSSGSWNSWLEYFHETDTLEERREEVSMEMEEAIARENFSEAAQLKLQLDDIIRRDTVKNVVEDMKVAVREERFTDAARHRDEGKVGIQGWWIASSAEDPTGSLVHIQPEYSRYTGRAYTMKDIAEANGFTEKDVFSILRDDRPVPLQEVGVPVLEVFLRRDEGGVMQHQACALRPPQPQENPDGSLSSGETGESVRVESEKDDEGRVVRMSVTFIKDNTDKTSPQELNQEAVTSISGWDKDLAASSIKCTEDDLLLGEVAEYHIRMPADVRWKDKDSFSLLIQKENNMPLGPKVQVPLPAETEVTLPDRMNKGIELQITGSRPTSLGSILSSQASTSADVLGELIMAVKKMHLAKTGTKLMVDQGQIVSALGHMIGAKEFDVHAVAKVARLLVTNMGQQLSFEGQVCFSRIKMDYAKTDPLCGLYLGAFGPHGPELLQLRRIECEDGEECVEGIKLTGDRNVPAGEVSFRVKVGRKRRLESRGIYPEDLGIVARYKGEGRVADHGFTNARWVEGELLQFSPSGSNKLTGGAQLGFVWSVPGARRFLILLNRMTLLGT